VVIGGQADRPWRQFAARRHDRTEALFIGSNLDSGRFELPFVRAIWTAAAFDT